MTKRKIALTRGISASIDRCEVSFIDRVPIDVQKMKQQHRAYEEMLQSMGYEVIQIPADDSCPDCCCIEEALAQGEAVFLQLRGHSGKSRRIRASSRRRPRRHGRELARNDDVTAPMQ